ncbi:hypothetical protein Tco_1541577 [Tanacetum coccineum]
MDTAKKANNEVLVYVWGAETTGSSGPMRTMYPHEPCQASVIQTILAGEDHALLLNVLDPVGFCQVYPTISLSLPINMAKRVGKLQLKPFCYPKVFSKVFDEKYSRSYGEDIVVFPKSFTHLWWLDAEVISPIPLAFNNGIPWVMVDLSGISQVDVGLEDEKSLAFDFLNSFLSPIRYLVDTHVIRFGVDTSKAAAIWHGISVNTHITMVDRLVVTFESHNLSQLIPAELKLFPIKINELTEFVDALKKYVQNLQMDFPTNILEISNKLSEFTKALSALTTKVEKLKGFKREILADLIALPDKFSNIIAQVAKLKVLDAILDILNKVVVSLDILVDVISSTSHKAQTSKGIVDDEEETNSDLDIEIRSSGTLEESSKSKPIKKFTYITNSALGQEVVDKFYKDKVKYDKYCLKILNRRAKGKIINYDVFTIGKGPINLKVYRDDDTTEVIYNFKVSDFHVGEWKNVLDAFPKRTRARWKDIYTQMRQRLDDVNKTAKELKQDLSCPLEE